MATTNRIVLVRHGETVGQSSIRYFGATDVALSQRGREQMREAALALPGNAFPLVVSSPLSRAWESARIVAPRGSSLRLLSELREVDFGEWEGLTAQEIQARDPVRFEDWRAGRDGFAYPGGECRADFEARVGRAVAAMLEIGAHSILVVVHKGVIQTIVRGLTDCELGPESPPLGGMLQLTREPGGGWSVGRPASYPHPNSLV